MILPVIPRGGLHFVIMNLAPGVRTLCEWGLNAWASLSARRVDLYRQFLARKFVPRGTCLVEAHAYGRASAWAERERVDAVASDSGTR